jgi:hypothetical protein
MRKPFDKKVYDEDDLKSKVAALDYLPTYFPGYKFELNPDKFGLDIIVSYYGTIVGYVECEVKYEWDGWIFPYADVNIPRKRDELIMQADDMPIIFFMTNKRVSRALVFDSIDIFSRKVVTLLKDDESLGEFYQIPISDVILLDIRKKS